MKQLPYIDRLAQAQWFERFGFVAVAVVGCLAIVVGKVVGAPSLAVTIGAVMLMLVYGAIMWRAIAGRVRADQAGDNLYYLGLLFTLTGLAYAIFTFRPEDSSNSIVEGFGIALATTIVGLMLRVFFNQVRLDLVETEERARLDLTQAAAELKSELGRIVVEMNDFGRQTRQALAEAVDGVEAGMINSVKEAGAGLARLSSTAETTVMTAFGRLEECSDELVGRTKEAGAAIGESAGSFRNLTQSLDTAAGRMNSFADASERTAGLSSNLIQQAEAARVVQDHVVASGASLRTQVEGVAQFLAEMRAGLEAGLAAQERRLKDLEQAPIATTEQFGQLLQQLQSQIQRDLTSVSETNVEALHGQLTAVRAAVATLQDLNSQLANELARSKGHVASVHGSLVTAVDELTNHLNRARP